MTNPLTSYRTLVFDCDGVVLDSNRVKTDAFYQAALPYGEAAAQALVAYHVANGGISRYAKFAWFLDEIVPAEVPGVTGPGLDALLSGYAGAVRKGLMTCAITPGLAALRQATSDARWLIVSGGDQAELREIFAARDLAPLFDGGIFGSPDTKDTILTREIAAGAIVQPALFLGDSRYDHVAASRAGLDFVFVSGWSEFSGWSEYLRDNELPEVKTVRVLLTSAGSTTRMRGSGRLTSMRRSKPT